jgi:predicted CopG family antitoxin
MIIMARNIALADDIYEQLNNMKRAGESFSSLIRRLLKTRASLSDLVGSSNMTVEEWSKMLDLKKKQALRDKERLESLTKQNSEES